MGAGLAPFESFRVIIPDRAGDRLYNERACPVVALYSYLLNNPRQADAVTLAIGMDVLRDCSHPRCGAIPARI